MAVSDYDQVIAKDNTQNRLSESVTLFGNIIVLKFFFNMPIILLLNKHDLFLEKITHSPLREHFPDYTGLDNDSVKALEFIKNLFFYQTKIPYGPCSLTRHVPQML